MAALSQDHSVTFGESCHRLWLVTIPYSPLAHMDATDRLNPHRGGDGRRAQPEHPLRVVSEVHVSR